VERKDRKMQCSQEMREWLFKLRTIAIIEIKERKRGILFSSEV